MICFKICEIFLKIRKFKVLFLNVLILRKKVFMWSVVIGDIRRMYVIMILINIIVVLLVFWEVVFLVDFFIIDLCFWLCLVNFSVIIGVMVIRKYIGIKE